MGDFIQLHLLTSYPPSNPNRDDLGRPKTAVMGGATRLRISSQSLKRAWRTSEVFQVALSGHVGTRTKEMGRRIHAQLTEKGVFDNNAKKWAQQIASQFGKPKGAKKDDPLIDLEIEQLAHFSPEEEQAIAALVEKLAAENRAPKDDELQLLRRHHTAVDIALFGRMLADAPRFNTDAAAQVAHAITVHRVQVEDDFFTAVDDLNTGEEDVGAGHMGESEFAAGLFYLYLCIDRASLRENLSGDDALASKALAALAEAVATVAPSGKRNSYGSHVRASYLLAERGGQQPRSLAVAFLKPVTGEDLLEEAIKRLEETRTAMDGAYGACADGQREMNLATGQGSLKDILTFIAE
jgi:CRISPR system Cascade subunit CasC